MPTVLQLKETRAKTWGRMQELAAKDEISAEERGEWDRLESSIDDQTKDIERRERFEARSYDLESLDDPEVTTTNGGTPTRDRGDVKELTPEQRAFDGWVRRGMAGLTPDDQAIMAGRASDIDTTQLAQVRAQGITPDTAGGYLVPQGFRNTVTEAMKFFGGIRGNANQITTDTGNELPWPTNDDTGNEGSYIGEHGPVTDQDLTFGQNKLQAHILTSKMIKVSTALLQDSAINLDALIGRKAGERIGRRENRAFTVGNGVGQPLGVATAATVGKLGPNGQTTSVTYNDFVDLMHSVDVAYRNERARWMWHDLSMAVLRKILDGDGRPLWEPSVQPGTPDTFLGRPYTVNNNMPTMAASQKSILFGDFLLGYIIRDVAAMSMTRLVERYAENLEVAFFITTRQDGKPDDANAVKAYQNSAV
jgi:HK97 family phage major capsid protein